MAKKEDHVLSEEELAKALEELPGWEVRENWLYHRYKTPGWAHTMMLAQTIGHLADAAFHHPDLHLGYASVSVRLQTHRVLAITYSDVELAKKIDEVVTWLPSEESPLEGFPKNWVR